jgi:hypothetical protein
MSEKYLPQADQVKCFFLTSPFIEPAQLPETDFGSGSDHTLGLDCLNARLTPKRAHARNPDYIV